MMRAALVIALACVGCTPGAVAAGASGGSSDVVIDMNLSTHPVRTLPEGSAGGYAPIPLTIALARPFAL